jgi:hypothetical protein
MWKTRKIAKVGILIGILAIPSVILLAFVLPTSFLLNLLHLEKSKLCDDFCQQLEHELIYANEQLDEVHREAVVSLANILKADTCVIVKSYSSTASSTLIQHGISRDVANEITPNMAEGLDLYLLKDDRIICHAHSFIADANSDLLVSQAGEHILLTVKSDYRAPVPHANDTKDHLCFHKLSVVSIH